MSRAKSAPITNHEEEKLQERPRSLSRRSPRLFAFDDEALNDYSDNSDNEEDQELTDAFKLIDKSQELREQIVRTQTLITSYDKLNNSNNPITSDNSELIQKLNSLKDTLSQLEHSYDYLVKELNQDNLPLFTQSPR